MIEKITLAQIAPKFAKVRNANPKAAARTYYLRFLKEEQNFFASTDKMNHYISDWSLKAIPEMFKSIGKFTKMALERAKSAYYFHK